MKKNLTPIERGLRNSIIWHLNRLGFTNNTIAHVMKVNESTLSRIVEKKPTHNKVVDTVLFGAELGEPRG